MERRTTTVNSSRARVERREDGEGAKVIGYAAVFYRDGDEGTEYRLWRGAKERIEKGAFERAIREGDDARALFNHDPNQLLGRLSAGTLRLAEDEVGLRYEIDVPDTSLGRDIVTSIDRGDLSGSSFAFVAEVEEWYDTDEDESIRNVKSVRLFDVGPVTYPAYEGTTTGTRDHDEVDDARASFDKFKAARDGEAHERARRKVDMDWRMVQIREDSA